ncbi:YcxB family protein [Clostridium tagluense]|uniref:YcxB family protein n=1 Tax=Clostridium tagluense TaxID=360422 RepID=UPI001CF4F23D|nr:YcxB family protein [Clostridium tagluense]MCB2312820.1 YcxB family protein [Clostridium tagluense]MCB2317586.1 YcxB family protein [Clostridium tagluense]MCB2322324.1 YcxB family protein [Clostridium tagluense]MCB2327327.1 YcxB family protein [Clostridium tagluense]MCB2332046.1 YcxB family protein [Clostridium tagluense]
MNLEYQITKQDYIDFNIYHMTHSVTMKRSLFILRFIFPIIFLVLPIFLIKITDIPLWYWSSVCIISSVLWIIFYPKFMKRSVEKRISKILEEGKTTGILGNHNFSFTEEGVVDKTEFSETKYNVIEKVVQSETHIFIYVSAVMAYIIPIRIFGSVDEKSEFLNILNKTLKVR